MIRLLIVSFAAFCCCANFAADAPFVIRVVDEQTGRGVPLVELRTPNDVLFVTDSAGISAVSGPDLLNRKVFFSVKSHGYEFPKDGFGSTGRALDVKPGASAELKVKRVNIAERLYRVTGGGIYADTVLAGQPAPITEPLLNAEVTGQDSVQTAEYNGKLYWFWGDTNKLSYTLGQFGTSGATSDLPKSGGLDPEKGVNLSYFKGKEGFSRSMVAIAEPGLRWIDGLCVLNDAAGKPRMFARCTRLKKLGEIYDMRVVAWNDATESFEHVALFDQKKLMPDGYAFVHEGYAYFCAPFPIIRVKATFEAAQDQSQYEAFTCLKPGSRVEKPEIERDAEGRAVWAWKRDTPALSAPKHNELLKSGVLKPGDARLSLKDGAGGENVVAHGFGSVAYNAYRKKWICLALQFGGKPSFLGEVWYAEADALEGPWGPATRIVTHDKYTFYNVRQHPYFDADGGRVIYFEGTYTAEFSGNPVHTPRYNYNQIMYRLNLDDPRLKR